MIPKALGLWGSFGKIEIVRPEEEIFNQENLFTEHLQHLLLLLPVQPGPQSKELLVRSVDVVDNSQPSMNRE